MIWRAFFIFTWSAVAVAAATPAGPMPELAQFGKPTPEEAAKLVAQFRTAGIPGEFYWEFELQQLLRRTDGPRFKGRLWGSRNADGAVTRIELTDAAGVAHRLLLQNGEHAKVWRLEAGRPVEMSVAQIMAPLVPGVEISAFDVQMPYLYWPGPTVEKLTRTLGRPSHAFLFPAPAAFKAQFPNVSAARAYLDTQFNAAMQSEILGADGKVTKTFALLTLQTVNKQTLPKSADYRNELTREKTRLQITAVALDLDLPESLFLPATLTQEGRLPPADKIVRINP